LNSISLTDKIHVDIPISAVTFGAGVQWYEAYDFFDQQGRFIVGGFRFDWWRIGFGSGVPGQVGSNIELASRFLPRMLAKGHPDEVARTALSVDGGMATRYVTREHSKKTLIRCSSIAGGAVS